MSRAVGIFVYPGFQLLDAAGPLTAFEIANRESPGAYRLAVVSLEGGSVMTSVGVAVDTAAASPAAQFDTLVVVGGEGCLQAMQHQASIDYLRGSQAMARRLCSVCSGAFVLASTGMLDGRRVTTHWHRANHFRTLFPAVRVEADCIYVRDGYKDPERMRRAFVRAFGQPPQVIRRINA